MDYIRSFISFNIPITPAIREPLEKLRSIRGVSVTKEVHLTLRFLGDVQEKKLKVLSEKMRSLENYSSFSVSMKGIGAFPKNTDPRVVWIGGDIGVPFYDILKEIDKMLDSSSIEYDKKPFKAHITIGRVRDPSKELTQFIVDRKDIEYGTFTVEEIFLMKSVLTPKGAEHSVLETIKLK
ncbi:MAG: RNA 2',3'-cyclic phosphodiesterase [Methanomassiliicoccaceae archaeon]|nr:RNA 2',3'-cyclic phosphodiesterase [Methanomassiliicoccaceae archaeon]